MENNDQDKALRLNKYIAHCGICTRRKAVDIIKAGLVKVNDQIEINPFYDVKVDDVIQYQNKVIEPHIEKVYVLINKPKNTLLKPDGINTKPTVIDLIKKSTTVEVLPVDNIDVNTSGLLVLTNDKKLIEKLSDPKHKMKKVYQLALDKAISVNEFEKIRKGVVLEDGQASIVGIDYVSGVEGNMEVGIEIHANGTNIIQRIFEHLGYQVLKLDRVYYAGLTKKDLPRGWSRLLTEREIIMLKHFV